MPGKLSTYHAKRNFAITPEPRGEIASATVQLRFVVQKHHARRLHYDFRLELDGTLKSWAVPKGPSLNPAEKRLAVHVEDHPLDYIDFEGDIPEHQYGAGHVDVWDIGYWEPQGDPLRGYQAGKLKFRLHGEKLHGGWSLVRTHLPGGGKEQWLLIKEKDDCARPGIDITESMPDSVLAEAPHDPAALANARRAPLPRTLAPQLATLVDAPPHSGDWLYEIKFDGYRLLARVDGDDIRLFTRDGKDWTGKLPRLVETIGTLGADSAWLDGEIVVLDKHGMPSFHLLQKAFDQERNAQIVYFLFDLPYLDGHDLRHAPLAERRALLRQLLAEVPAETLRYSVPLQESPQKLLDSACRLAMEGLIGKRTDSPYTGKRSESWIKLKCRHRQEFVIAGYTEPQGSRKFFGALLLGVNEGGKLRYAGRVGTGFDRAILHAIHKQLKALEQDACPFAEVPSDTRRAGTHWVKPQLVAEISFAEWTQDGMLRQAAFDGLRTDKPAAQVQREEAVSAPANGKRRKRAAPAEPAVADTARPQVRNIRITNPERIIDSASGLTKLDLARYYERIADHILPYLENRPVYLLRAPEGIDGERFFQKHSTHMTIPGVRALDPALDPGHGPLMAIDSVHALVGAAQMGALELHTCNATADRIDRPDCMVFDLDPDPALPWARVVEGAELTRVVLDELGLESFLKTSGGKGLHLVVPLVRQHDWEVVTEFSHAVARHLSHMLPKHFSAKMGERNRVGKIFVDYLRNRRAASTVAPYSVRARAGLPVATPIAWEELKEIGGAAMWTAATLPQRLKEIGSDPWRDYFKAKQMLTASMKKQLGIGLK